MSEDADFNPNWWLDAKAASLKRRSHVLPKATLARPGDAFLIVTEGTVTEPIYFDLLLYDLQLSPIRIKVQPGCHSDPRTVILTAEREAKEQQRKARKGTLAINEPSKFDHVWAVIDTDVAVHQNIWNDVQQLASARKVRLAHSTPCFEFWLLLHFGFTTRADLIDGDAAKKAVKVALGRDYSTDEEIAKEAIASFFANWPKAVEYAEGVRSYHRAAATPLPANPSTEVDRLIRALNDSALEHVRKIRSP